MIELSIVEFILFGLPLTLMGVLLCVALISAIYSEISDMRYKKKMARGEELMENGMCGKFDTALTGATYQVRFGEKEFTQEQQDEIRELFITYLDGTAAVFYGELDELNISLAKRYLSDKKRNYILERMAECWRLLSCLAFMRDYGVDAYLNYLQSFRYIGPFCCEEEKNDADT